MLAIEVEEAGSRRCELKVGVKRRKEGNEISVRFVLDLLVGSSIRLYLLANEN